MAKSSRRRKRICRNWTELPEKATASILSRLGAIEILESAQKVCMKWRKLCKDPFMWSKIDMRNDGEVNYDLEEMCRHAVDRSSGNLVDINIEYFGTDELLEYITERRLRLLYCDDISDGGLSKVASKLPLLEELDISLCQNISHKALAMVGSSCPLLKSFKFNKEWCQFSHDGRGPYEFHFSNHYPRILKAYRKRDQVTFHGILDYDAEALAIAGTMHGLRHLQLFGNKLTDDGLRSILDCCPDLGSLDLRHCFILNMEGDLRRICDERIEKLWLPHDSTEGKEFVARSEAYCFKWTELPDDVTVLILSQLGGIDILTSAQKVCSKWFRICKDPLMWRTIDMCNNFDINNYKPFFFHELCEHAIERSCGKMVDINVENFGTNELLKYHIAESSTGLKRLRLVTSFRITDEGFREVASKFPLLEDLDLSIHEDISHETLALVGRSCPLLKSLKFNKRWFDEGRYNNRYKLERNDCALAIAGTMHGLHHLMLFRNTLTNKGLCAILDGCPHLESLDMRQCFNLRLGGKVGRRCAEQIKELRLPHDSVDDIDPSYQFVFDQ
ncbi:putative F-box/LRR-repeat protein 23 [Rosa sericea]